MIKWLQAYKRPWIWFLVHILLGFVSTLSSVAVILYFYLVFLTSLRVFVYREKNKTLLALLIAYLVPFEIICRMAETSPFIPYELSKYLQFILLLFGLFSWKSFGRIGLIMLILLVPGLFYDLSGKVDFKGIVFNILAPINLCLGVIYFYKQKIAAEDFKKIIIAIVLPLISALIYTYIKTPDYDQIEFQLGANFATTGGFGSNQVSTVFGLGMFLVFYLRYSRILISGYSFIDLGILILFVLQGLLSFSRGGMIGGAIAILIFLYFSLSNNERGSKKTPKYSTYLVPVIFLILATVWVANDITEGQLLLRYQGETAGTLSGNKEKDINTITSNRADIFQGDILLFYDNPMGVGAGASRFLRLTQNDVASHVEFSRLLAEHGYFGLIFFMILTFLPLIFFRKNSSLEFKGFLIAMFFLAWYTSFHAATRNFVTPLLIGISLMTIVNENNLKVSNKFGLS